MLWRSQPSAREEGSGLDLLTKGGGRVRECAKMRKTTTLDEVSKGVQTPSIFLATPLV